MTKAQQIGATCVCFNLRRATRAVTQLYDEATRPAGVRVTQFTLLSAIGSLEPVTVGRLAHAVGMDRTTLTRNLQPLSKRKLVELGPGADQRERHISLAEKGEQTLARALPRWERAQAEMSRRLGADRLQQLVEMLRETATAVRAK